MKDERPAPDSPPAAVTLAAFAMVAQALCGVWVLSISAVQRPGASWLMGAAVAFSVWTTAVPLVILRPFVLGRCWAWAAALGLYAASGVISLASVGALVLQPQAGIRMGGCRVLIETALTVLIWSSRDWFGVPERRAASTLWRQGWWAITVTAGLALALLVAFLAGAGD